MSKGMLRSGVWEHVLMDLKAHEGFRSKAYQDTVGVWTIGYGFTHGVKRGDVISREGAEDLLSEIIAIAILDIRDILGHSVFAALDGPRQAVMINMSYNLGRNRMSKFLETLKAVRNGDYAKAARQMRASRWCEQVGGRCHELAKSMTEGVFIPRVPHPPHR